MWGGSIPDFSSGGLKREFDRGGEIVVVCIVYSGYE